MEGGARRRVRGLEGLDLEVLVKSSEKSTDGDMMAVCQNVLEDYDIVNSNGKNLGGFLDLYVCGSGSDKGSVDKIFEDEDCISQQHLRSPVPLKRPRTNVISG